MNQGFKEIHPGHFVRIKNGKAIESISKEEVDYLTMLADGSDVDSGIIQVALALAAILAVVTSISTSLILKIAMNTAFLASTISAFFLYAAYCEKRVPRMISGFFYTRFKKYHSLSLLWMLLYFFVALVKYLFAWKQTPVQDHEDIVELSYVLLLYAMLIAAFSIEIFILIDIVKALYPGITVQL